MSIVKKEKWQKYFKQEEKILTEPAIFDNHKMKSRRDFLAAGLQSGLGVMYASAGLKLLASNPVLAANCAPSQLGSNWLPFVEIYLSGGPLMAMRQFAVGRSNNPMDLSGLSNNDFMRWGIDPSQSGSFSTIGAGNKGFRMFNASPFRQGMSLFLSPAQLERINGYVVLRQNNDDTGNNEMAMGHLVNRAMLTSSKIPLLGSNNNGTSYVNTELAANSYNPLITPDIVSNLQTLTSKYNLDPLGKNGDGSDLSNKSAKIQKVLEYVSSRSVASIQKLEMTANSPPALTQKISCDFQGNIGNANGPGFTADPTQYSVVNSVMGPGNGITANGQAFNFNTDNELARIAAMTTAVCQGAANVMGITLGGYDYHNQGNNTQNQKDLIAGAKFGAIARCLMDAGKGGYVCVYADGQTSGGSNSALDGTFASQENDSGQFSNVVVLTWLPQGDVQTIRNNGGNANSSAQIGSITGTGVQNNSWIGYNNNTAAAEVVVYNYMALHGREGEFNTIFPSAVLAGVDKSQLQVLPSGLVTL